MSSISSCYSQREREVYPARRPSRWEFEGYQHASWVGGGRVVLDKCTRLRGNFREFSYFETVEDDMHDMSRPEVEENSQSSARISTRELQSQRGRETIHRCCTTSGNSTSSTALRTFHAGGFRKVRLERQPPRT